MRALVFTLALLAAPAVAQVGTLDPTFGTGGLVVDDFEGYDDFYGVAPLPDGTLAVVGRSSHTYSLPNTQSARYVRYDAAGTRLGAWRYDNGVFGCSVPEAFYDLVVEPGGTVLAGGFAQFDCGGPQRDFWVHRIQPDGSSVVFARPTFFGVFENTWGLARHPDGRVTAGGIASPTTGSDTRDLAFTRYTSDGEVDLTYGTMGETTVDTYGDYDFLYDLLALPDGGVVAAGFAYDGSQYDALLVRLDADGRPDAAFGTDGVVTLGDGSTNDYAYQLARQPDGRLLAVAQLGAPGGGPRPVVLGLAPDGTLDPTFGTDGVAVVGFGGSQPFANGLVLQSDGKIVVAGGAGEAGAHDVAIGRLLADGSPDPTFGTDGVQTASWSDHDDLARDLAILPDGDFVVLGITLEDVGGDRVQDLGLARFIGDTAPVAAEASPAAALALRAVPNPTRGPLALRVGLPEAGPVRLTVHDALGREVAVLADGPRAAGAHTVGLDAGPLPPGVYLVRLAAGGVVIARPVSVVR